MSRQLRTRHTLCALTGLLAAAALVITPGPARATAAGAPAPPCQSWTSTLPPSPGAGDNEFFGVTALSACNVWALGHADNSTLILHWNGTAWAQVPSPSPGAGNDLSGVDAVSATSAWAVGEFSDSGFH